MIRFHSSQAAIHSCPVECIHWVQKQELPALEYVMQRKITERPNVGIMMSGQGDYVPDVFTASTRYMKKRKEKCAALTLALGVGSEWVSAVDPKNRVHRYPRMRVCGLLCICTVYTSPNFVRPRVLHPATFQKCQASRHSQH